MSKIYDNGHYRELTAEEIEKMQAEEKRFAQTQDYGELVESLIRRKYSLSAELSLHRQQFRKPEEFAEYDAYAEQCKMEAKEMLQGGKQ